MRSTHKTLLFLSLLVSLSFPVRAAAVRGDATILGGVTTGGGEDARAGLRFVEVAVSPSERTRVWAQYDDTLSLDSSALSRAGTRAPAWYAGGLASYGGRWITRLEAGWRRLDGDVDQGIVRGEQVLVLGDSALKAGAWVGPREDDRVETILHAGASIGLGDRLSLEPTAFYARSGLEDEQELRVLLGATWRLRGGAEVGGGAAVGRFSSPVPGADGTPGSLFARASIPWRSARLILQAGREWAASGPATSLALVGISFAAGGRP